MTNAASTFPIVVAATMIDILFVGFSEKWLGQFPRPVWILTISSEKSHSLKDFFSEASNSGRAGPKAEIPTLVYGGKSEQDDW